MLSDYPQKVGKPLRRQGLSRRYEFVAVTSIRGRLYAVICPRQTPNLLKLIPATESERGWYWVEGYTAAKD